MKEPCAYFVLLNPNLPPNLPEEAQAASGQDLRPLATATACHWESGYSNPKLSSLWAEQKEAQSSPDQIIVVLKTTKFWGGLLHSNG